MKQRRWKQRKHFRKKPKRKGFYKAGRGKKKKAVAPQQLTKSKQGLMVAYCMTCRKKLPMSNPTLFTAKGNRKMYKGTCPKGHMMYKIAPAKAYSRFNVGKRPKGTEQLLFRQASKLTKKSLDKPRDVDEILKELRIKKI